MKLLKIFNFAVLFCSVLFASSASLYAQFKPSAIKIGYLNPKDADSGLLLGFDFATPIDETVELGVSSNFFYTNYNKVSTVAIADPQGGIQETTKQQELEYTTFSIPLYAMINIVIPSTRFFGYQLHGGLGYEFLFNKENNYKENTSERRRYSGLSWETSAGFHYIIGSRSALTGEILYHSAKPSRNKTSSKAGLPTWSEVNLSGFGIRFGIRFDII